MLCSSGRDNRSDRSHTFAPEVGFHKVLRSSVTTIGNGKPGWSGLSGAARQGVNQDPPPPGAERRGRFEVDEQCGTRDSYYVCLFSMF